MPPRPSPAVQGAGAPSLRDHLAEFLNRNNYIPVWLKPHVAAGVLRHFGRDGSAIVHPHPSTGYGGAPPQRFVSGGVASGAPEPLGPPVQAGGGDRFSSAGAAGPTAFAAGFRRPAFEGGPVPPVAPPTAGAATAPAFAGPPMRGIPASMAAPRDGRRSIFAGGAIGAAGPKMQQPLAARGGRVLDGTGGGNVPGKDLGRDSVHAMLQPGEMVANKKQLQGIQVKPGKGHLLRADQKRAIKQAGKRGQNAR